MITAHSLLELQRMEIEPKKGIQRKDFWSVVLDYPVRRNKETESSRRDANQSISADEHSTITECSGEAHEPEIHDSLKVS